MYSTNQQELRFCAQIPSKPFTVFGFPLCLVVGKRAFGLLSLQTHAHVVQGRYLTLLKYLLYKRGETFAVYTKQRNCFSKDKVISKINSAINKT